MRRIAGLLTILFGLSGHGLAAQHLQLGEGSFGFVSSDGTELVALDSLANPTRIRAALCSRARVFRVSYARKQARGSADNGRQVAANFPNQPGAVFRVAGGKASADETCYLSADSTLVASAAPVNAPAATTCDAARIRRMSQAKHRPVLHCWPLASVQPNVQVIAVQFALVDTSALASLVVVSQDRLLFQDFPATYRGPDSDIWRVDDGGTFSPHAFGILFFCRLRGTYVMALTWAGAESEDSYLLVADSADTFRSVATSYRYWVPI
jgi:hypothetical protein